MSEARYILRTVAEEPALEKAMTRLIDRGWPALVLESRNAFREMPIDWFGIYRRWPHLQFALFEEGSDDPIACGNSLPLAWDGDPTALPERGWSWAMVSAVEDLEAGRTPRTHCALGITILPEARGRALSAVMVRAMKQLGRAAGLKQLIAPVRPNRKALYPLSSIHDYAQWATPEGLPFDPWLRVHARLGARLLHVCAESMGMTGPLADWERWSGLRFPVSGPYAIPDCLAPVQIDVEQGSGLYIEPNVWMIHPSEDPTGDLA